LFVRVDLFVEPGYQFADFGVCFLFSDHIGYEKEAI